MLRFAELTHVFEKDRNYFALLIALFAVAFLIPILFITSFFSGSRSTLPTQESEVDAFFSHATSISAAPSFLRVKKSAHLSPIVGEDFLLTVWFRLKKFPQPGEQVGFIAKIDASDRSRRGYTIGLTREERDLRPFVTWRNAEGEGRYQLFSEVALLPRQWYMLALSFVDDSFLGIHLGHIEGEGEIVLEPLGGYEMEEDIRPDSDSDLVLGAQRNGRFRGLLGPFGVFSGEDLGENLEGTLREMLEHPLSLPESIEMEHVLLWSVDGVQDLSENKLELKRVGTGKRSKVKNR